MSKRFITLESEGSRFTTQCTIILDKETGINYLFVKSGYGAGLTPLLDSEGKVVITK